MKNKAFHVCVDWDCSYIYNILYTCILSLYSPNTNFKLPTEEGQEESRWQSIVNKMRSARVSEEK